MSNQNIKTPFFVFNPQSYLYGEELLKLASTADELAKQYDIPVFVTGPFTDLKTLKESTDQVIVTAQHIDGIVPGRGMGHVLPESIRNAGAKATFLNHAERPMSLLELSQAIKRTKELGLISIVCAASIPEAKAIAQMNPDIISCEPTELTCIGETSSEIYIWETIHAIKTINDKILVMQAAGITTAGDVYRTIVLGADGTGCTNGIVKAENPEKMLISMVKAAVKAKKSLREQMMNIANG